MTDLHPSFQIAIDGPVAAGKGTVSRLVADKLGFLYVDTGAMYRVAALIGQREKIDLDNAQSLAPLIKKAKISMRNPNSSEQDGRLTTVFLNDEDVSWKIRIEEVSQGASKVAVHPSIREILVTKQQAIASTQNVVMEGRDITYRVLPNADLKIFLTANDVVRAKRRHFELLTKGMNLEFEEVYQDLQDRDNRDKNRATDPLKITDDAWVIDTSDLSIKQVVKLVIDKVKIMMKDKTF
ncbi:MAG: Cytidylate kinase [Microgenomates bacterium 39_7]|nr:MAG: Cytidylate kinase [Microgenomates bacterium 39_7]